MDTLELKIDLSPKNPWSDILIAELAELGFDSFVDTKKGIIAYGNVDLDVEQLISETSMVSDDTVSYSIAHKIIPYQNWNASWESKFHPVYVEDYASILAPFHTDDQARGMKVIIKPQMSFGTGHHQTTWMMTKALFELDSMPARVLDMGTGTGVLAIVAENLGASRILAVDIEHWSAENAILNAKGNNCNRIEVKCGDIELVQNESFGLIIANINKNILKSHLSAYAAHLEPGGVLLLSGFFITDIDEMVDVSEQNGLKLTKRFVKDEWAAIQLLK